jgi:hypothetical protein
MRRTHKYADGGKVTQDHIAEEKARKAKNAKGGAYQPPKPMSAADAIKNSTAKKMEELGLRDGGKVKRKC